MANITNSAAIQFSNQQVRPSADKMASSYNRAVAVKNRWTALGSNQAALNQMQPDILNAASMILQAYDLLYWTEKAWFGVTGDE